MVIITPFSLKMSYISVYPYNLFRIDIKKATTPTGRGFTSYITLFITIGKRHK